MSSNDYTLTGYLLEYFMSNVPLKKNLFFKPVDIQLKFIVNNLFNKDYLSVLSRPMPGTSSEFLIGTTLKFGKNKEKSENINMQRYEGIKELKPAVTTCIGIHRLSQ